MPHEIMPQELESKVKAGEPLLVVDIREPWEREIARLPGDVHVPLDEFPRRAADLRAPQGGALVLYCHAGVRSWMAAEFLENQGVSGVFSLAGGIDAWSCLVDPSIVRY